MKDVYQNFQIFEEGILKAFRGYRELEFAIEVEGQLVFLHPNVCFDKQGKIFIDGVNISRLILTLNEERLKKFKNIFDEVEQLLSTYFSIVIDNHKDTLCLKSDVEKLLKLILLPPERTKLQMVLNDFTYIYLIKDTDTGFVKIGRSNTPESRLQSLIKQATFQPTPNNFTFISYWLDKTWVETRLHERFASQRIRGEWFELSEADVQEIKDQYIDRSEEAVKQKLF